MTSTGHRGRQFQPPMYGPGLDVGMVDSKKRPDETVDAEQYAGSKGHDTSVPGYVKVQATGGQYLGAEGVDQLWTGL